jgi:uncharacterized membrane protein YqjE
VFETLKKSRQLSLIILDRLGDYLALLRLEMKMQGREIGIQIAGFAAAALCAVFALLFVGFAIIITFWDSPYRALAAWVVVALYALGMLAGWSLARSHAGKVNTLGTLRDEIRRDAALVRESL